MFHSFERWAVRALGTAGAVVMLAGPAAADGKGGDPQAALDPPSDPQLARQVERAILRYPHYSVFEAVEGHVENGVVLLRGSVTNSNHKKDIVSSVEKLPGVVKVEARIRVQPASPLDDRLRSQLYRAIYGGDRYGQFAGATNPPVRIIVDHGNVTLKGVVASPVDRQVIGNIARQTESFRVKNDLRVEGEEPEAERKPTI